MIEPSLGPQITPAGSCVGTKSMDVDGECMIQRPLYFKKNVWFSPCFPFFRCNIFALELFVPLRLGSTSAVLSSTKRTLFRNSAERKRWRRIRGWWRLARWWLGSTAGTMGRHLGWQHGTWDMLGFIPVFVVITHIFCHLGLIQ